MTHEELLEAFWSKVDKRGEDECWNWTAARDKRKGYGLFGTKKISKSTKAHRISWELVHGPAPDGMSVCHHCDNPPCVNPKHLFLGTNYDNVLDKLSKNRQQKGEDFPSAILTERAVVEVFELNQLGMNNEEIGRVIGVGSTTISHILRGHDWKHVDTPYRGCAKNNNTLPDETVVEIFRLYRETRSMCKVAEQLGLGDGTVFSVLKRITHSDVEIPTELMVDIRPQTKLTEQDVVEVFRLKSLGFESDEIGKRLDISRSNVNMILRRATWAHVPIPQKYLDILTTTTAQ